VRYEKEQEGQTLQKIDLKKELKHLYMPSSKEVSLVDVPEMQFAKVDGRIEADETPAGSSHFQDATGALYGISYTLKFMSKRSEENPIDYGVMALEGLWSTDSGAFNPTRREPWNFTLMIMQPAHVTESMFREALQKLRKKKPNPLLDSLRFEPFHEGLSMQIIHIGRYADEPRTLALMQAFAEENGYVYRGRHHEIYLGDPRKAKPEKLQTVLRQPLEMLAV
jgi:hypothetical protein